jgi:anti-sigma B factor antagonist
MPKLEGHADDDGVLWLEGDFDLAATDDFWRLARASVDGQREFVLELSGVSFLDSSGIRAVVALARELDGRGLVLRNPAENVRKVLRLVDVVGRDGIRRDPA